jgi:hypothetical protein
MYLSADSEFLLNRILKSLSFDFVDKHDLEQIQKLKFNIDLNIKDLI